MGRIASDVDVAHYVVEIINIHNDGVSREYRKSYFVLAGEAA